MRNFVGALFRRVGAVADALPGVTSAAIAFFKPLGPVQPDLPAAAAQYVLKRDNPSVLLTLAGAGAHAT